MKYKLCTQCGETKPATPAYFLRRTAGQNTIMLPCRDCHKARMKVANKKNYKNNRELCLIRQYTWWDSKFDLTCDLDVEWFKEHISSQPCHYCGTETESIGCDRINNDIGHMKDNVLPCCQICNKVRNDIFTVAEMKLLGKEIARINLLGYRRLHAQRTN